MAPSPAASEPNVNYSFTPQQCWNADLDSIPAKKQTLHNYAGTVTDVWHECDNADYPYSDYNEAVGVRNERKLRSEYVQDDYHLRASKLHGENNRIDDRHNVAVERARLKDEQRENTKPIMTVFGAIYYLILLMIIARVSMSMYDEGTLFSEGNLAASSLFLFFSLLLLAAPLSVPRLSKDSYVFWKRWVPARYKELGIRPEKHPEAAENRPPQPFIDAQRQVLRDVGGRMQCWKYDAEKDSRAIVQSATNRESCERERKLEEPPSDNQYCWGSDEFCQTRNCSGNWKNWTTDCTLPDGRTDVTHYLNILEGDIHQKGVGYKTVEWNEETAAQMGGTKCQYKNNRPKGFEDVPLETLGLHRDTGSVDGLTAESELQKGHILRHYDQETCPVDCLGKWDHLTGAFGKVPKRYFLPDRYSNSDGLCKPKYQKGEGTLNVNYNYGNENGGIYLEYQGKKSDWSGDHLATLPALGASANAAGSNPGASAAGSNPGASAADVVQSPSPSAAESLPAAAKITYEWQTGEWDNCDDFTVSAKRAAPTCVSSYGVLADDTKCIAGLKPPELERQGITPVNMDDETQFDNTLNVVWVLDSYESAAISKELNLINSKSFWAHPLHNSIDDGSFRSFEIKRINLSIDEYKELIQRLHNFMKNYKTDDNIKNNINNVNVIFLTVDYKSVYVLNNLGLKYEKSPSEYGPNKIQCLRTYSEGLRFIPEGMQKISKMFINNEDVTNVMSCKNVYDQYIYEGVRETAYMRSAMLLAIEILTKQQNAKYSLLIAYTRKREPSTFYKLTKTKSLNIDVELNEKFKEFIKGSNNYATYVEKEEIIRDPIAPEISVLKEFSLTYQFSGTSIETASVVSPPTITTPVPSPTTPVPSPTTPAAAQITYEWQTGEWSNCDFERQATRKLTCKSSIDDQVDAANCKDKPKPSNLERPIITPVDITRNIASQETKDKTLNVVWLLDSYRSAAIDEKLNLIDLHNTKRVENNGEVKWITSHEGNICPIGYSKKKFALYNFEKQYNKDKTINIHLTKESYIKLIKLLYDNTHFHFIPESLIEIELVNVLIMVTDDNKAFILNDLDKNNFHKTDSNYINFGDKYKYFDNYKYENIDIFTKKFINNDNVTDVLGCNYEYYGQQSHQSYVKNAIGLAIQILQKKKNAKYSLLIAYSEDWEQPTLSIRDADLELLLSRYYSSEHNYAAWIKKKSEFTHGKIVFLNKNNPSPLPSPSLSDEQLSQFRIRAFDAFIEEVDEPISQEQKNIIKEYFLDERIKNYTRLMYFHNHLYRAFKITGDSFSKIIDKEEQYIRDEIEKVLVRSLLYRKAELIVQSYGDEGNIFNQHPTEVSSFCRGIVYESINPARFMNGGEGKRKPTKNEIEYANKICKGMFDNVKDEYDIKEEYEPASVGSKYDGYVQAKGTTWLKDKCIEEYKKTYPRKIQSDTIEWICTVENYEIV